MARTLTLRAGKHNKHQKGFTYLIVLAAVVVLGIFAETATMLTSTQIKRANEAELLFRGQAYIHAIKSYYESGKTVKTYPRRLGDLIKDPRYIHKKHIRKLYSDPFNESRWGIITSGDGRIKGVYSVSQGKPQKTNNFPTGLESFTDSETYKDWRFEYNPTPPIKKT